MNEERLHQERMTIEERLSLNDVESELKMGWIMQLLNVNEIAARLSHSPQTIRNLITRGLLDCYRCPGIRVSEEQLEAYLARSNQPASVNHSSRRKPTPQAIQHLDADRLREAWRQQSVD